MTRNIGFIALAFMVLLAALPAADAQTRRFQNREYVALNQVATRLGMKFSWLERGKSGQLTSQWSKLSFTEHKRDCVINGVRVHLGFAVIAAQGRLYIAQEDYRKTLLPILAPQNSGAVPQLRRIVLDPGHGGKDDGGSNARLRVKEKDLTLDLARRMKPLLERQGYQVYLTRERDVFVDLAERSRIANRLKADLFVSLHFNAASDSSARGVEVFTMTPVGHPSSNSTRTYSNQSQTYAGNRHEDWSQLAAYQLQQSMLGAVKWPDRGVRRARFAVLRDLNCPGVLLEGGFMTNATEGAALRSPALRQRLAEAYVQGIVDYHKMLDQARQRQPGR